MAYISLVSLSLGLQGCTGPLDLDIHADDSPQALSDIWGIQVPPTMATKEFYSSDVGFQGDGDFVRVLTLPESDQVGDWAPESFHESLDEGRAAAIISDSKAEVRVGELDDLRCHPPINREDGDYLMLCHSKASGVFYSFESIS